MSDGETAKATEDEEASTAPEASDKTEAEDASQGIGDTPEKPKGKLAGKMKYIIAVAVVLVLGGIGGGLYFFGFFHIEKPHETTIELPDEPELHDMQTMTVNLKPSKKHPRPFIKLTVQVELENKNAVQAFIANETRIIDLMQTHLRGVQYEDLEGSAGLQRLREDLTIIINRVIQPEHAITVLYNEIFMR